MRKALICGQWEMEFNEIENEEYSGTGYEPFHRQIIGRHQRAVSASTAGGYLLLKDLPKNKRVVEFFGGIGIQSTLIHHLLSPLEHTAIENNLDSIKLLKKLEFVRAIHGDACEWIGKIEADIYLLDWYTWTIGHWGEWKTYFDLLFATNPEAITFLDRAKPYLHRNKELYGRLLGAPISDIRSYAAALSKFFLEYSEYGFSKVVYLPTAMYCLLRKGCRKFSEEWVNSRNNGFIWLT